MTTRRQFLAGTAGTALAGVTLPQLAGESAAQQASTYPTYPLYGLETNPSVGRNADGRLELFAAGPNGDFVAARRQLVPNGEWGDWVLFAGPTQGAPWVATNADGRLEVFKLDRRTNRGDERIWQVWQAAPSNGWAPWHDFGAGRPQLPVVGQEADGRLHAFQGSLHRWQLAPNGIWSGWTPFDGGTGILPRVARTGSGLLMLFYGNQYRRQLRPNAVTEWTDWQYLGGSTNNVIVDHRGRLHVFLNRGDELWHSWYLSGDSWAAGEYLGGFNGSLTPALNADGRLEIFGWIGPSERVLFRWQRSVDGPWSNWVDFEAPFSALPVVVPNADGRLEAFLIPPGGESIAQRWQLRPNGITGWSPWHFFPGPARARARSDTML